MRFKLLATKIQKICLLMALMLASQFSIVSSAQAQEQSPSKPLEAWEQAQDYSLAHPVIAFAVYGKTQDSTARENAEKIKAYFAQHNIKSIYFLGKENRMGASLALFIQGVAYGPKALSKALPLIHQAIAHFKEEYGSS